MKLAALLIVLVLAGCVTPTKPTKLDPRDPEVITTHKTVMYPTISEAPAPSTFDGRCPTCKAAGLTSTLEVGAMTTTLLATMQWYDEQGVYHSGQDRNTRTQHYRCSRGHSFAQIR